MFTTYLDNQSTSAKKSIGSAGKILWNIVELWEKSEIGLKFNIQKQKKIVKQNEQLVKIWENSFASKAYAYQKLSSLVKKIEKNIGIVKLLLGNVKICPSDKWFWWLFVILPL